MATTRPRYTVSVDDELFKQIEDFRYRNRYATRSQATCELIRRGLASMEKSSPGSEDSENTLHSL